MARRSGDRVLSRKTWLPVAAMCAAGLIVLLAGCDGRPGSPSDPTRSPMGTPPASPDPATAQPGLLRPLEAITAPQILALCPAIDAIHFDGNAAPVRRILICSSTTVLSITAPDPGRPPTLQRAGVVVGGADALLEAYAKPNAPASKGACPELAADPLIIWLDTATGTIPVYAPVDECGFPSDSAVSAYRAITLQKIIELEL